MRSRHLPCPICPGGLQSAEYGDVPDYLRQSTELSASCLMVFKEAHELKAQKELKVGTALLRQQCDVATPDQPGP